MEKTTKEKVHEYYLKNKEKILDVRWRHYLKNRDKRIAQANAWALKNKEKVKAIKRRWKEKHSFQEKIRQATKYKYRDTPFGDCSLCGKQGTARHHNTEPYHVDKFVILCASCHYKLHRRRK